LKKGLVFIFLTAFFLNLNAQKTISILDSSSHQPIVGACLGNFKHNIVLYSDFNGRISLPYFLNSEDTVKICMLGYDGIQLRIEQIAETIYLSPKNYHLREAIIRPISPKEYIQRAFDSFHRNHVPFEFRQNVFFREEYIVNNDYLRFQEMDMEVYQFPKKNDSRKYYISGSYPKVKSIYRMDNYKKMEEVKSAMGKWLSKPLNFNYLSVYSYAKGVNILNFIFTTLLEDPQATYKLLGMENVKGYNALHIQGEHFDDGELKFTSHIFLDENSYAVVHFSVLAADYDITKKYLDFKTRAFLWIMGIRFKVKKYYAKIQFEKNSYGFWSVEDFMAMVPIEFKKRIALDGYMNISYRMSNHIEKTNIPIGYKIYQENQTLFDNYKSASRFGDNLQYAIPLTPIQKERLRKMITR